MAVQVLWSAIWGIIAILALGGLLALAAIYLPRFLRRGEAGAAVNWGLGKMTAGPFAPAEPAPAPGPGPEPERPPVVLPAREPLPQRPAAAPDEPLLAAAISLALTLYQQEQRPAPETAGSRPGSPWALSGRWQAMQDRLSRQKR